MRAGLIHRRLSVLLIGAAVAAGGATARADDAACQAVLDAVIKQTTIPVHQKITIESAAAPGKPLRSEMIHIGDRLYMQVAGKWMTRPYDGKKSMADAREAMKKAEHSCTRVRSEAVDGQPADLYSVKTKTASGDSDSRIWISPTTGLPLRQHTVMLENGAAKMKHDVRFDYANVRAPPDVAR